MLSKLTMSLKREQGFVLPTAIFLLVVMATLAAVMVRISVAGQTMAVQDVQNVRALQAARVGIEAGLYAVHRNNNCPGGTLSNLTGLNGFSVSWSCTQTAFTENGVSKQLWQITSTATYGSSSDADFFERQLIATTEYGS